MSEDMPSIPRSSPTTGVSKYFSQPPPSAVSTLISSSGANSGSGVLPIEVQHNLQHQHGWTDLRLDTVSILIPDRSNPPPVSGNSNGDNNNHGNPDSVPALAPSSVTLISGLPPRHTYIHPDFQSHLLKHEIAESSVPVQREYVLPLSLGETRWTLQRFCAVFDALPERSVLHGADGFEWRDSKRVLLGLLAHNGMGGDGTVAYYIMQEGDVKPRQNG